MTLVIHFAIGVRKVKRKENLKWAVMKYDMII